MGDRKMGKKRGMKEKVEEGENTQDISRWIFSVTFHYTSIMLVCMLGKNMTATYVCGWSSLQRPSWD